MPKIPQHFLDCSIYLYESREAAEGGEKLGGSGCLVRIESNPIYDPDSFSGGRYTRAALFFPPHIYAVTNKHVVESSPVIRLNTVDDKIDVLELESDDWIQHPDGDDLVVAPIDLPEGKYSFSPVPIELFAHRNSVLLYVGAGDDTFMVGRFINHAGKQRNTPSLRFGNIAMLPFEKIRLENGYMQEAFLVETRSISGYSGSPVFVYKPAEWTTHIAGRNPYEDTYVKSITDLVGHPRFLGVDCGHVPEYKELLKADGENHGYGWKVESNTGMAIVIPAWRLADLLNTAELVMQRKQKDKEYKEKEEAEKQDGSTVFDVKKPEGFSAEDYQDALKRASRKIGKDEEKKP